MLLAGKSDNEQSDTLLVTLQTPLKECSDPIRRGNSGSTSARVDRRKPQSFARSSRKAGGQLVTRLCKDTYCHKRDSSCVKSAGMELCGTRSPQRPSSIDKTCCGNVYVRLNWRRTSEATIVELCTDLNFFANENVKPQDRGARLRIYRFGAQTTVTSAAAAAHARLMRAHEADKER